MEEQLFKDELKKLKEILAEENYSMMFDGSYPIRLHVQPFQGIEGQMQMLEAAEIGESFNSPDAKFSLRYVLDDVHLDTVGRLTISDDLYRKVKSRFKTASIYYMAMIHKLAMDNQLLGSLKYGGDDE